MAGHKKRGFWYYACTHASKGTKIGCIRWTPKDMLPRTADRGKCWPEDEDMPVPTGKPEDKSSTPGKRQKKEHV